MLWLSEFCPLDCWIVWIMPTEDYGAWFQFDLARFLATPATGSKHIFFSILPTQREYNMLYHVLFICNSSMWTFLGRFWLIVVNLLGISTRLQIKFRGNCRADLMVSFRVQASRKQHRLDCYHFVCPAIVLHHLQWILPQILKTKKEKQDNLEIFPGKREYFLGIQKSPTWQCKNWHGSVASNVGIWHVS